MGPQAEKRRRVEGESLPSHFPIDLNEGHEGEGSKENVGVAGNSEEKNMAELDMFVISAALAGVPFLKAKIKAFVTKKEFHLKGKILELERELSLKTRQVGELEIQNSKLQQMLKKEQENSHAIKKHAKARELSYKIQIDSANELRKKTNELRKKTKAEKDRYKRKVEEANIAITNNFEKIRKLEAQKLAWGNIGNTSQAAQKVLSNGETNKMELGGPIEKVKMEYQETSVTFGTFSEKKLSKMQDLQVQNLFKMEHQADQMEEANARTCSFCNIEFSSKGQLKSHKLRCAWGIAPIVML